MRRFVPILLVLLMPAAGQEKKGKKPAPPFRFTLTKQAKRPSIRIGNILRTDLRLSFQTDWRGFEPEGSSEEPTFDLHRSRVGIEGEFLRYFEYEFDYELGDTDFPWRDAYINFRPVRWFQVRGGKFKIPFSLNQLEGPTRLDFVYRSRLGALIAPARDVGAEIRGRFLDRGLTYEVGVFSHDGETARFNDDTQPGGGTTWAGRITGMPLRLLPAPKPLQGLTLGAAATTSQVTEGMKSLRIRTIGRETVFPRMFVNGHRRRLGSELSWIQGPVSIKGEFAEVRDERKGQSLRGEDLPDLLSRAWYLAGTWVLTGQSHLVREEPPAHLMNGRGIGAVEIAARYEQMRFSSAGPAGVMPSRSTRAANVLAQSDRIWTFGVNWYVNRWVKTQVNGIREKIEDLQRSPIPGKPRLWTWVVRIQYIL